jgi:hypothetical protein
LVQDVAKTRIPTASSAICYRKVQACNVAGEEYRDVKEACGRIGGIWWQLKLSITGYVDGYLEQVFLGSVRAHGKLKRLDRPPPSGVFG